MPFLHHNYSRQLRVAMFCLCAVIGPIAPTVANAATRPLVVTSIKPLHLIVLALAGDAVDAQSLRSSSGSPHDFALKPSELRLLHAAARIFWIGPRLETPLAELFAREPLAFSQTALLDSVLGSPATADTDPHIWLDPQQGAAIARLIGAELVRSGLLDAGHMHARLARFETALAAQERTMHGRLDPVRERPFLVVHDGYRQFETRFGLRQIGALAFDEEYRVGARRMLELRRSARDSGAVCLFREPGGSARLAETIAEGTGLRVAELDALAYDTVPGDAAYLQFLDGFARTIADCLAPQTTATVEIPLHE